MRETTTAKRPRGRPPAGPDGSKVADLPRISLRLEPATKNLLEAAAKVTGRPAWRIGQDAIAAYLAELPAKERRQATALARKAAR
ncbi:MAG: hypothetical protein GY719_15500 [bacterium]|nr:hypothetical protein [bacterium]